MKTKHQRGRQKKESFDGEVGKKRMEEYLKATQSQFETAVERASLLGLEATGVLAGQRVRAEKLLPETSGALAGPVRKSSPSSRID